MFFKSSLKPCACCYQSFEMSSSWSLKEEAEMVSRNMDGLHPFACEYDLIARRCKKIELFIFRHGSLGSSLLFWSLTLSLFPFFPNCEVRVARFYKGSPSPSSSCQLHSQLQMPVATAGPQLPAPDARPQPGAPHRALPDLNRQKDCQKICHMECQTGWRCARLNTRECQIECHGGGRSHQVVFVRFFSLSCPYIAAWPGCLPSLKFWSGAVSES